MAERSSIEESRVGDNLDLSGGRLAAVVATWKEKRKVVSTRFGGESMLPTISSEVELELHCGVRPEIGDVIAYELRDQIIVHRVIALVRGFVLSRGDASLIPDSPVPVDRVIGVVKRATEKGRERPLDPPSRTVGAAGLDQAVAGLLRVSARLAAACVWILWLTRRVLIKVSEAARLE